MNQLVKYYVVLNSFKYSRTNFDALLTFSGRNDLRCDLFIQQIMIIRLSNHLIKLNKN